MALLWIVPAIVALMIFKGFCSGSEIALVNADRIHLRHRAARGHRGAAEVLKLERSPELYLATTLVGTNLAIVALTTLATVVMVRLLGERGELYAIAVLSPLLLILTEVVPKSVFQQKADVLAPIVIWPLRVVMVLLFPVVFAFARIARLAQRLVNGKQVHPFMSREMIRAVLDAAEKVADVDDLTWNGLKRAVRLTDITVGEVMIPMAEVTAVGHRESTRRAIQLARARGHLRLPVYEDEVSAIIGVVAFDVWKLMTPGFVDTPLETLIQPAEYVVAQQPVHELLGVLRRRADGMALVVDEFGSAIGMVTLEDIQEAVVGEAARVGHALPGATHHRHQTIEALSEDSYLMDARVSVAEVNELLATHLPAGEAHTIGGLVTARLRHLPRPDEYVVAGGYRFTVQERTGRLVTRLRVEPA